MLRPRHLEGTWVEPLTPRAFGLAVSACWRDIGRARHAVLGPHACQALSDRSIRACQGLETRTIFQPGLADVGLDLVSQTQTPVPKRDQGEAALLDNRDAAADIDSKHALHSRKDLHPLLWTRVAREIAEKRACLSRELLAVAKHGRDVETNPGNPQCRFAEQRGTDLLHYLGSKRRALLLKDCGSRADILRKKCLAYGRLPHSEASNVSVCRRRLYAWPVPTLDQSDRAAPMKRGNVHTWQA